MLAIELKFLAGRYHATPWGRHVNEADVAWPPDAWRFVRGLVATWHRKVDKEAFPETILAELVEKLAEELPVYRLPNAVHTHTRHYMPIRSGKSEKPVLVYDAFARVSDDQSIVMNWPNLQLASEELHLLDELLDCMGYLGRAESWLEARRLEQWEDQPNCFPGDQAVDPETGELREVVSCLSPIPSSDYEAVRDKHLKAQGKKSPKKLVKTLPETLLDALRLDTADLQAAGWSRPPAARSVSYLRHADALKAQPYSQSTSPASVYTTARFMLVGKPRPRIEDSLKVGEWMRRAVLGRAKHTFGEDAIPAYLSGHGLAEGNRHEHAFYLPDDADGDGYIDHIWIYVPASLCAQSQHVLGKLNFIRTDDGHEWQLVLESIADNSVFGGKTLSGCARQWLSATPYLHPWHVKKKLGIKDQIKRECEARGLLVPRAIERVPEINIHGKPRRPVHFHRFRNKRGLTQPDTRGSFWKLTFDEPVQGPLALGFGCHFGLGMFKPLPG